MEDISIKIIEVRILALTAFFAFLVWYQAKKHFAMQASMRFIERLNDPNLTTKRNLVDNVIRSLRCDNEPVSYVKHRYFGSESQEEATKEELASIRAITNLFQELGAAWKNNAVARRFTANVFAGVVTMYWKDLSPYIHALREDRGRKTLLEDFETLAKNIEKEDK